jgi:hypothetical protein
MAHSSDVDRVVKSLNDVHLDAEKLRSVVGSSTETLQLQERIVRSARDIITAIEGPKQVVKNLAREVRTNSPVDCRS